MDEKAHCQCNCSKETNTPRRLCSVLVSFEERGILQYGNQYAHKGGRDLCDQCQDHNPKWMVNQRTEHRQRLPGHLEKKTERE